jgi:hypothetical protein
MSPFSSHFPSIILSNPHSAQFVFGSGDFLNTEGITPDAYAFKP